MQNIHSNEITAFLLTITLLILLLAGFILTILFLYRKKQMNYFENLETIKAEFQNNLLNTQLEIQEQTFENISKEIHDNINLSLTLAKLNLIAMTEKKGSEYTNYGENTISLISKAIIDLNDISKRMNSDMLENVGLIGAIEMEVERIKKSSLFDISLSVVGNPQYFESKTELLLYRIIQESLNNVIKHSKATAVQIELDYEPNHISITVNDNGCGFSIEKVGNSVGSGLKNMRSRAKVLNGHLSIITETNNGTTINVKIPI